MLRVESATAAKHLVDSLRTTITTSAESLEGLKRSLNHRPPGSLSEASTFCNTLRTDIDQLQTDVAPIQPLTKAPQACDLLDAGLGQIDVVDRILGMFEQRLQEAYGIEVKVKEGNPEVREDVDVPSQAVYNVEDVSAIARSHTPRQKTPKARKSPQFEDVMPATPKLEDFGISSADLEVLEAPPRKDTFAVDGTPTYRGDTDYTTGVEIGSGDYSEAVAKSMSALGIETPVQVADKFSARRHIALRGVMPGATPRMTAGKGKMLDYTGLAGGYYEKRQLDFGGEEDGLRDKYETVEGYWKESCSFEAVMKAVELVKEMGDGGTQDEMVGLFEERLDVMDGLAVLVGLTKMKILSVRKRDGVAIYRYKE